MRLADEKIRGLNLPGTLLLILDNKNTLGNFLDSTYLEFFRVLVRISGQMKGDDQ